MSRAKHPSVRFGPGVDSAPDRRVVRKLAAAKTDSIEVDGVWWHRHRNGEWDVQAGFFGEEEDDEQQP